MAVSGVLLMAPACHECGRRSRAIEQLRGLLVASSLLPADLQRPVDLLDLPRLLAGLDGSDRRTVASWVRWQVLAPLRRPATRRHDFDIAVRKARRRLRQAVEFTAQLHRDGRQLARLSKPTSMRGRRTRRRSTPCPAVPDLGAAPRSSPQDPATAD